MAPLRILVTGSRSWTDRASIAAALDQAWRDYGSPAHVTLVHGKCPYGGADLIAEEIALSRGWLPESHEANFKDLGRKAGPLRNGLMVDLGADVLLAFPEEGSRGTWDCVRRAEKAGIPVRVLPAD